MDLNRKKLLGLLMYLIPLALAGSINLRGTYGIGLLLPGPNGITASLILAGVCLKWGLSVRRRFPQTQMRNNMTLFSAAFLLLSILSHVKYSFSPAGGTLARYLWYAYYVPLTFGPLFMVHASLYFGKPDDYRISKRWYWTYLPAALLSLGILTNDLHQLAFRFPNGFVNGEQSYTRGVLYYLAAVWIGLALLAVIALAVRSTFHRRLFKTAWLPLAVLTMEALYAVLYVSHGTEWFFLQRVFQMNDFICVSSIALWESFVIARIVVSNSDYPAIFAVSSLNAGLADGDGTVRQVSAEGARPQPEALRAAQNGETLLPDENTLLKARAVTGGWFYWTEDLTELRRLREQLDDTAGYLEEENAMLRVSAQIEEGRRQTEEQTKLYDRMTEALRPQLDALDGLLHDLPEDEAALRETMKKAGVLIAYVKRRGNLLLLADSNPVLTGEELGLCFEESAKALRVAGVPCEVFVGQNVLIPSGDAVALYEAFETVAERAVGALRSAKITLQAQPGNRTVMELTLESAIEPTEEALADLRRRFDEVTSDRDAGLLRLLRRNASAAHSL